jgi:hypothetical protein
MTTLSPRTACAAGLLSLGALLLSGCASSGGTGSASASSQASTSSSGGRGGAAMAAYRQCLSQHGVTMPSGRPSARPSGGYGGGNGGGNGGGYGGGGFGFGGGASANPTMAAAMQACASLRPKFNGGGKGGHGGFNSTAMAAFTSCMKDHGVTLPTKGGVRALNTADPKTSAAFNVCKVLIPARGAGASPSASPSA